MSAGIVSVSNSTAPSIMRTTFIPSRDSNFAANESKPEMNVA